MKKYIDEFKEFINKGDVVMVAVGLVMALYFKAIVDAILAGVINPIIAAIFGEPDSSPSASTSATPFSIGLVINAIISFLVVAIFLFVDRQGLQRLEGKPLGSRPIRRPVAGGHPAHRDPRRAARPARAERPDHPGRDVRVRGSAGSMSECRAGSARSLDARSSACARRGLARLGRGLRCERRGGARAPATVGGVGALPPVTIAGRADRARSRPRPRRPSPR